MRIARAMGALDIGQGAVVAHGVVLAVEAQEGTDALLRRIATLPAALRGAGGVLAKAPKPIQERRVDLPTLGVATIEAAAMAGLVGIVGEAGGVLVLDRAAVAATADRLELFVCGEARASLEMASVTDILTRWTLEIASGCAVIWGRRCGGSDWALRRRARLRRC